MLEDPDALMLIPEVVEFMKSQDIDPINMEIANKKPKSKAASKAPSAVLPLPSVFQVLPSVVPGTSVANIGGKHPFEEANDRSTSGKYVSNGNREIDT